MSQTTTRTYWCIVNLKSLASQLFTSFMCRTLTHMYPTNNNNRNLLDQLIFLDTELGHEDIALEILENSRQVHSMTTTRLKRHLQQQHVQNDFELTENAQLLLIE